MQPEESDQPEKGGKPEKLEDRLRGVVRRKGYSIRTERTYAGWYRQYVMYHRLRHPSEMGAVEITGQFTLLLTSSFRLPAERVVVGRVGGGGLWRLRFPG